MATPVRFRKNTAANAASNNATLAAGEPGFETDTKVFKIGDASTAWNSLSSPALVYVAGALTDGANIALTGAKHTLTSDEATITFTISYTGDDITIELTLNATSSTWTFPASSLCVSEGVASGDNTLSLSGTSGDKYIISIKKIGSNYYVIAKNFGQ